MTTISNLVVKMTGDESGLVRATRRGAAALKDLGKAGRQLALLGSAAGAAAIGGLALLGKASSENIDRLQKLSRNLGVTASAAQQLELVAELTGVGASDMAKGFQQATRVIGDAGRGMKSAGEAIEDLGLTVGQLEQMDPTQQFNAIVAGLRAIEDPAKRASLASVFFGRAWRKMVPLIEEGQGAAKVARRVYEELGLGLDSANRSTEGLNDNLTSLQALGVAARDKVFEALAPSLEQFSAQAFEVGANLIKAAGGGEKFAQILAGALTEQVRSGIDGLAKLAEVAGTVGAALGAVFDFVQGVGRVGGLLAAAGAAVGRGEFGGALSLLREDVGDVARGDEDVKPELEEQTRLLRQILQKSGVAFQ